jgi:hypothetical protein
MEPTLSPQLIREYNRVLADLTNVIVNDQLAALLGVLERVPDPGDDLRQSFETDPGRLRRASSWLDYLRLLRFSVNLRVALSEQYDLFVQAYQQLSVFPNPGADERKLLGEIGDFMYNIDDISGDYERLSVRMVTELSKSLKLTYGILHEPNEKLYSHEVHEDNAARLRPLIVELITLCGVMREQVNIMTALMRMRKLILKF